MFVVFDLDGTIALNEHRVHHIRKTPKDYDAFYSACVDDTPCKPVLNTLFAHIVAGHRVEIWTGRSDQVWGETCTWLSQHSLAQPPSKFFLPPLLKRMRGARDHQPDVELKRAWLKEIRKNGEAVPDLTYEDRDRVVAMWREEGIHCFQVALCPF